MALRQRLVALNLAVFLSVIGYVGGFSRADQRGSGRVQCPHCEKDGSEVSQLLDKADAIYARFDSPEALKLLTRVLELDPRNYEALSKVARVYIDFGDNIPETTPDWEKKRLRQYHIAEQYARKAVKANPKGTWGHFYIAASLGKIAVLSTVPKQIDLSREIRQEVEKSIALDPQNGFAYHIYGVWQRKMAEIGKASRFLASVVLWRSVPKGTLKKSVEYLKKSLSLHPAIIASHLEIARTYMAMHEWRIARKHLKTVEQLPIQFSDDFRHKEKAQQLLQEIKDR
ncbi:MAG: tetratricopeptide repeat protein [Candidatus Binatia bacterium]